MKFKVGDKVIVTSTKDFLQEYNGTVSFIKSINPNDYILKKEHYGIGLPYVFYPEDLELVESAKDESSKKKSEPHIYHSGDKVRVVSDTLFHCIPYGTEVKLIDRNLSWKVKYKEDILFIPECDFIPAESTDLSAELFNGRVVCISDRWSGFTKGKIYEFKNGCTVDDNGDRCPRGDKFLFSIKDMHSDAGKEIFLIIVE